MDANWRPEQGSDPAAGAGVDPPPTGGDWHAQLQPEARSRIVNKIMDTLKKHLPVSAPEGLNELQKIAVLFEEKIYTAATSQSDYLRKISLKMLSMEMKTQQAPGNAQVIPNQNNSAPGLPPQGTNQVHTSAIPLISQQQARQPSTSTSVQASSLTNIGQNLPGVNQTSTMQNVSVMPQNTMNNGLAQGTSQDIYAAQRQMAGRQQQQQSQQSIYHQQQMLMKQKLQHNSLMQPHIPQQQYLLQPTQMQSSQQSMMQMSSGLHPRQSTLPQTQPMTMQSATQSGIQQYQLNSVQQSVQSLLQQPQQSMHQQPSLQSQQPNIPLQQQQQVQPSMHQQPSLQSQQPNIPLQQQQQQLMGQQPNLQQNQLIGQQNGVVEMQQQQRLPVQSNNLLNVQQTQQMLNQQYMPFQPQQLGFQANMSSLQQQQQNQQQQQQQNQQQQQQQQLRTVPNVSNMQWMHMIQTKAQQPQQQQHAQQPPMGLMQPQSEHNKLQQSQQHLMSQFQSQPNQLQQQLGMQQQFSMQQRFQTSGGMLLQQNNMDQQKQFILAQKGLQEVSSSTSADSTAQSGHAGTGDWQEEIYQMIQRLKDQYFAELSELFNKLSLKLQHVDSIVPPQEPSEKYDRMKSFKIILDRILQMLQISKSTIQPAMRDKIPQYEKQIISILNSQRRKPVQRPI